MIPFLKQQRASSVLGLALDSNRLEAVALRRTNGVLQVRQTLSAPLALSPLTGDPELVGREIRNHLEQAGIRESRCAVCIPLSWVLTQQIKLPEMSEADLTGFLQIEAERGFPSGSENLFVSHSRFKSPDGGNYATLLAVPRSHLTALERVLRAAKLKPFTFALGVSALQPAGDERVVTLAAGNSNLDLQVTGGGGIVVVRSLDGALETEGGQKQISADFVARELRITLAQLPGDWTQGRMRMFGQGEVARQFVKEISARATAMGLKTEAVERASVAEFDKPLPADLAVSPAVAVAAASLQGMKFAPDFLPPKVQAWQQMVSSARLSPRKLAYAGGVMGGLILCVLLAFGFQQWQIMRLQSKWDSMKTRVADLNAAQQQIRKYRPWFDESRKPRYILRALTQAFPEDGVVSAKTVEIRDLATVTCSGVARDNQSFLRLLDQLRAATNDISEVRVDQVRGQSPLQFTFNFQWEGGAANGN